MLKLLWEIIKCIVGESKEGAGVDKVVKKIGYTVERGSYRSESKMDKGEKMEAEVYKDIKSILKGYNKVKVNMLIPTKYGSTQIDVVLISQEGVYVIECKNYGERGKEVRLKGLLNEGEWLVEYPNGKEYKIYNTVMQNQGHIENIKRVLGVGIPIYSYVVFSDNVKIVRNLKNIREYKGTKTKVCNMREFRYMLEYQDMSEKKLSREEVRELSKKCDEYVRVGKKEEKKHAEYVERYQRQKKKSSPKR